MNLGSTATSDQPAPDHGSSRLDDWPQQPKSPQRIRFRAMSYPRKRAVTACERCRIKKTKCDNERPQCTACLKNGLPCSYDPRLDHSSFDPASLLILERLNEVISKVDHIAGTTAANAATRPVQPTNISQEAELVEVEAPLIIGDDSAEDVQSRQTADTGGSAVSTGDVNQPCSPDSLEVTAPFSSTDCVLTWPVFAGRWPSNVLSQELLAGCIPSPSPPSPNNTQEPAPFTHRRQKPGVREEDVPQLVSQFLQFVYPKNPILYVEELHDHAKRIAEDGFGWDPTSCLVLTICALGAVSSPFDPATEEGRLYGRASIHEGASRRETAEAYFHAARKRIGLLGPHSLTTVQCHMLSAMYLFYTMRIVEAWYALNQAGTILSLYVKARVAQEERTGVTHHGRPQKHLEQRLYWTVLKSECEVRTELDLPQSDLCKLEYPHQFPSPPSPQSPVLVPTTPASITTMTTPHSTSSTSSSQGIEEQSWFYYLSEISLRRTENRILNRFYKTTHDSWTRMNVEGMVSFVVDIEDQLTVWHSSLPECIRFDNLPPGQVMDELRLVTGGRSINLRALLYRPFLYLAVHAPHTISAPSVSLSTAEMINEFVKKALDVCLFFIRDHAMTHRHHGTWYGLREYATVALTLVAAEKGGLILWNSLEPNGALTENEYGRAVRICVEKLRYWEDENPTDIKQARQILEQLVQDRD